MCQCCSSESQGGVVEWKKSESKKKDPSVQEAVELIHKTGRNPLEKEVQEALPGLELVRAGATANPRRSRAKRRSH